MSAPESIRIVERNDSEGAKLPARQITAPNFNEGGNADELGLYPASSGDRILEAFSASYCCDTSRYHLDFALLDRMHPSGMARAPAGHLAS